MSKPRKLIYRVVCVLVALMLVVSMQPMTTVTPAAKTVAELEAEQKALRDKIAKLEEERKNLSKDLNGKLLDKANLEQQIALKQDEIDLNQAAIDDANDTIAQKEAEIAARQQAVQEEFAYLKERLNQVSKTGNMTSFQMLISTESYVDYLIKAKVMETVAQNDEETIARLEEEMTAIAAEKAEIEEQRAVLESRQAELEALKAEIDERYDALAALVHDLESDIAYYKKQIALSEAEEKKLENDIKEMLAANDSGLSYKGGTMYWPSKQCTILTSTYGWRWGSLHKGIDLACYGNATGKDIRAAADGTVIAVNNTSEWGYGWCSGYGYCVMVDHGYDKKGRRITTLYAHMSKVMVSVGQQVTGGSTQLGKVGNTGNSFGAHLHFEVRLDGTAVDPIGNGYVKVP